MDGSRVSACGSGRIVGAFVTFPPDCGSRTGEPSAVLRRKTMTYAAGLASVAALAGCGGGGGGGGAPTTHLIAATPSSTSVATPMSAAPTSAEPNFPPGLPSAAKKQTESASRAFVEHFVDVVNSSWHEPNPQAIRAMCSAASKACSSFVDDAIEMKVKNQHYSSSAFRATEIESFPLDPANQRVKARIQVLGTSVVDASGKVVYFETPRSFQAMFHLAWGRGGWALTAMKELR